MKKVALMVSVAAAAIAPASADAIGSEALEITPAADMPLREFVPKRWDRLRWTNRARAARCRVAVHFRLGSSAIKPWRRRENLNHWENRNRRSHSLTCGVHRAVKWVFGGYWPEAARVVECESHGWSRPKGALSAVNGRFVGVLQMGDSERRRYGWYTAGAPALVQVKSGHAYFVASGSDWSPWECQP